MNIKLTIEPSVFVPPSRVIHSVSIQVVSLVLFQGATLLATILDENEYPVDTRFFELKGDEYAQWNNDDSWVVNYVLEKLSFTKREQ